MYNIKMYLLGTNVSNFCLLSTLNCINYLLIYIQLPKYAIKWSSLHVISIFKYKNIYFTYQMYVP